MSDDTSKLTGRELTIDERVAIATRFYGLYMAPTWLADARLHVDEKTRNFHLTDITCAMDNMRVPFLEGQLSSEEREYLKSDRSVP